MTRINVGLHPSELCDQHLLAEYRELPRLFGKTSKLSPPSSFRLGSGHCRWCQQYQRSLALRQQYIIHELQHRGYALTFTTTPAECMLGLEWPAKEVGRARPIVIKRVQDRLAGAKRQPTWTRRQPPAWAACVLPWAR